MINLLIGHGCPIILKIKAEMEIFRITFWLPDVTPVSQTVKFARPDLEANRAQAQPILPFVKFGFHPWKSQSKLHSLRASCVAAPPPAWRLYIFPKSRHVRGCRRQRCKTEAGALSRSAGVMCF